MNWPTFVLEESGLPTSEPKSMWIERDDKLLREFKFEDFQEAFTFMTRVAFLAEAQGHHPAMHNEYNYVRIELCTHDAGNVVTQRDRQLAAAIDKILS